MAQHHLCGAWRGATAASAGETSAHMTGDHTRTSFLASAGILYGAEIKSRQRKSQLEEDKITRLSRLQVTGGQTCR